MNTKLKRSRADRISRRVTKLLDPLGFKRTKTRFWIRPRPHILEFVHLHLFSFELAFRVHLGLRVLNDPFEAAALNGPDSDSHRDFQLGFEDSEASLDRCAGQISEFVRDVGEPWFRSWNDQQKLLEDRTSPLNTEAKAGLAAAIAGSAIAGNIQRSRLLLGAA